MKTFLLYLRRLVIGPITASFIISAGWMWYHYTHHPHAKFIWMTIAVAAAILVANKIFKELYRWLIIKFERHYFWRTDFYYFLDELFFLCSLYFIVFFSRNELLSLGIFAVVSLAVFIRLDDFLGRHPDDDWRTAGRAIFVLGCVIFFVDAFFQYFSYANYILDSNIKFYNIVLFRSIAMSTLWMAGFALASMLYVSIAGRFRHAFLVFWLAAYIFALFIGVANVGVLSQSSLYLSPEVVAHAGGGGMKVYLWPGVILVAAFLAVSTIFILVIGRFVKKHNNIDRRVWYFYDFGIILLALMALFTVASLRSTPEAKILAAFVNEWRGANPTATLNPVVQNKLEKFGITPNLNEFYINERDNVYSTTTKLLPNKFDKKKPNIVIVFLESFSSRLTSVYNPDLKGLTPGLEAMASATGTTIFHKVYNGSTPTITGLLAELCSFLPPTGHNEIQNEKHLQKHHLYCLPKALSDNGYESNLYITAVDKEFANKDSILGSMGVKESWGTFELSKKISGAPLAWGYSDHQMFPELYNEMKVKRAENAEPFLLMLSTVDTHPPFNLAKDVVSYGDGSNNLFNSYHTTDDAFAKFWNEFVKSDFATDTIVVAIADHAVFPTAYDKDTLPNLAGKMTFYDELAFMTYIPDSILPKEVNTLASSLDLAPTLLQILGINTANTFEGRSIFDDRAKYPNLLGMHEFGLWIDQTSFTTTSAQIDYAPPMDLNCTEEIIGASSTAPLTLCEYKNYYEWKRLMLEEGRLWYMEK
ncbi:MAG: LTA synthase family protein [Patescibacteria group bacterium]